MFDYGKYHENKKIFKKKDFLFLFFMFGILNYLTFIYGRENKLNEFEKIDFFFIFSLKYNISK